MAHQMRSPTELRDEIKNEIDALRRRLAELEVAADSPLAPRASPDMVRHGVALVRGLMQARQVGYGVGRADGTIVDVNDAFANLLGYDRRELLSLPVTWAQLTPPEYAEIDARALQAVRSTGRPQSYAKEFFHRDGSRIPTVLIAMQTSYVLDEFAAFVLDDSARLRTEAMLRRSEANLRTAQTLAQMGSFDLPLSSDEEPYWSGEVYRILGIPADSGPLHPEEYIERFVRPDHAARVAAVVEALAREGRSFDVTYPIVRPSGAERWVRGIAAAVRDASGAVTGMVGTIIDVTEQREAEARLRQAHQIEAVGALASGFAHDFNNVLGSVTGYAELTLAAAKGHPEIERGLERILQASRHASVLVGRLLLLGKQAEPKRERLLVQKMIDEVVEMLQPTRPPGVDIEVAVDPRAPAIVADETQVLQVLLNLGTNALHAMADSGGVLTIRLEPFVVDEVFAAQHAPLRPGPHVRLSVSDTGEGIPPEIIDRVAEPFFTTKAPGKGSGLGLPIVHGIVRDHEGAIELESTPGAGTTVRIILPAVAAEHDVAAAEEIPRGAGQRILLVDDECDLVATSQRSLEALGYAVLAFTDPRSALDAFRQRPQHFDLVLTDQSMPHLSGIDLARELHRIRPAVPVVLVSGRGARAYETARLRAAGISHLIAKPVTQEALARALRDALDAARAAPDFR